MVVYVDVLIFLNTIVDYLLLCLTERLTGYNARMWRKVLSAFTASLFSLYIFLPTMQFIIDILVRLLCSFTTILVCFGFGSLKKFVVNSCSFFIISFVYAGVMMGIYMLFTPNKMMVGGGIVYFDISPLVLITASFLFYLGMVFVKKITKRNCETAERCEVTLATESTKTNTMAMLDTGHSLGDAYGDNLMIIIDRDTAVKLFGAENTVRLLSFDQNAVSGFRLVPVKTVSGDKLLPAVKLLSAKFKIANLSKTVSSPIAVISDGVLGDDYSVIAPPSAVYE